MQLTDTHTHTFEQTIEAADVNLAMERVSTARASLQKWSRDVRGDIVCVNVYAGVTYCGPLT